jgi:hypothetical protein
MALSTMAWIATLLAVTQAAPRQFRQPLGSGNPPAVRVAHVAGLASPAASPPRSQRTAAPSQPQAQAPVSAQAPAARAGVRVDFQRQIVPVISSRCLECHSGEKRSGGLSLASYDDVIEGGRHGAVVRPGNSAGSLIIRQLTHQAEPGMPKDEDPLDPALIALIQQWIDQGARQTPSSPPAPQPWEAPLTLEQPATPKAVWAGWQSPLDRFTATYLAKNPRQTAPPASISDAAFARRVYLDVWGLLPSPDELRAFLDDRRPDRRARLVATLLADSQKYAEHWMSFWNDLLRNDEGTSYHSETASRKTITPWLYPALKANLPYDQFVTKLLNPAVPDDPEGFLIGVNWRGVVSASQTPAMQAAQNTAQIFLGLNLKCNSCHNSFISKWSLQDAYALASFFSTDAKLQLHRCDVPLNRFAEPAFLFPELDRRPSSNALSDRRATAAAIFTDPRNGRMPRTIVNRLWHRLFGRGFVENPDEMDRRPWSPELLDWLASDFVAHDYDLKYLIATILSSKTYQLPALTRTGEPPKHYAFRGPELRRLTAEQFTDAIGAITGVWRVTPVPAPAVAPGAPTAATATVARTAGASATATPAASATPAAAAAPTSLSAPIGMYSREWRGASTSLTRALGRPIRDQVYSTRDEQATTLQALELVNGTALTHWLLRGAREMLHELKSSPASLFNTRIAPLDKGTDGAFDVDVAKATKLWLMVQDTGSTALDKAQPIWANAELVDANGKAVPLASLSPLDEADFRAPAATTPGDGAGVPVAAATNAKNAGDTSNAAVAANVAAVSSSSGVRVKMPSRLVYDISGKGFTRFRGNAGLEPIALATGENVRGLALVFDTEPDMDRLVPPAPGTPLPAPPALTSIPQVVDRVFWHALGRAPTVAERRIAESALRNPAPSESGTAGRPSAEGLADLLWAVMMKPEFQFIY